MSRKQSLTKRLKSASAILIPLILRALGDMLNHNHVLFAREIIKALSDLVEVHPTFFKQNVVSPVPSHR